MPSHNINELWKQLRTELLGDGALVALLADNQQIWKAYQPGRLKFPAIVMRFSADNPPPPASSFTGRWRPALQVSIYAPTWDKCWDIVSQLDSAWTIPANRNTPIESTNFRLTFLRRINAIEVGDLIAVDNGQNIQHLATEWNTRIQVKPS